jgi:hypothetical protein
MNDQPKDLAEILKAQLGMVTLVVLLSGTVYADAYYSQFGLKLSSMGFSSSYVIYRGITAVLASPSVAIPYLLSVLWMLIDEFYIGKETFWRRLRMPAAYLVVLFVVASSYLLAYRAGVKRALDDMHVESSTLPRLKSSTPSIPGCEPDACRVLFTDSESIYIFQPVPASQSATVPNIRARARKAYDEIITGMQ